jgi:hypothetical protein
VGVGYVARSKKQGARSKKQEGRTKNQRSRKGEARSKKEEGRTPTERLLPSDRHVILASCFLILDSRKEARSKK